MKLMNQVKKYGAIAVGSAGLVAVSSQSYAEGWDYATLTAGVDYTSIGTGVLAVAAMLAAVYAGIKGARVILGFLRS